MAWRYNLPKCPVSPADRGEFMKPKIQSSDGGVEMQTRDGAAAAPIPNVKAGIASGPSEAPSSVSTPAQDATALADRLDELAVQYAGDYGYNIASDLKAASAILRATSQTPDAVRDALKRLLAAFEGLRPFPLVVDAVAQGLIADAKAALSTPSASAGPQAEAAAKTHSQRSELDDASNACLEFASKHGYATGHGDTVADMIREFSAQIPAHPQPQQADGRGAVIELAAWLCALEDAECHKPVPESLIEHGRRYIHAGMTEKHCGDCTNESHSCVVCGTDGYLLHARQIRAALSATDGPAK